MTYEGWKKIGKNRYVETLKYKYDGEVEEVEKLNELQRYLYAKFMDKTFATAYLTDTRLKKYCNERLKVYVMCGIIMKYLFKKISICQYDYIGGRHNVEKTIADLKL